MNARIFQILSILVAAFVTLAIPLTAHAEGAPGASEFRGAFNSVQKQLEASIQELDALRKQIADEKIPLDRKLNDRESDLLKVRQEMQQVSRLLDSRTLDLTNLRGEIKARQDEESYLSNLFGEYIRNFESRLHIAELQRYRSTIEVGRLAGENPNLSPTQVYEAQVAVIDASLGRLESALDGMRFDGTAVDADGLVKEGKFFVLGPAALFQSKDGQRVGTAEQRLGSLEPTILPFQDPALTEAASEAVSGKGSVIPFDPTLGNAHVIETTHETLVEHVKKGGPVMVPIFVLAGAAFLVALFKWFGLLLVRKPSRRQLNAVFDAVASRDSEAAMYAVRRVPGPTGKMLAAGVEHLDHPHELIEEVMYERLLTSRLKLQRMLPFIAVSAAAAPLLGLLGTVTGIIATFKLITVFGTGDVKTLSGGISEALITTEFGLIVAIPSLLMHAFLSRKARAVVDQMEKAALAFMNEVGKAQGAQAVAAGAGHAANEPDLVVIPSVIKSALDKIADKLGHHDRDAIGTALQQLNKSAADLVRAVYVAGVAEAGAPAEGSSDYAGEEESKKRKHAHV